MGRKRKEKGLALNQSHRKKMKRYANPKKGNDNTSTIAYSDPKATNSPSSTLAYEDLRSQFTADKGLHDILDKLSQISQEIIEDISTDCHIHCFESKDEPTQMTKQSFTIIYFITYKKTIHFKLICKNVHS